MVIFAWIFGVIFIVLFTGWVVYFEEYIIWRRVLKHIDKVKFGQRTNKGYLFEVYGNSIPVATIEWDNGSLYINDMISGSIYVQALPYIILNYRVKKALKAMIPEEEELRWNKLRKKTFLDYL